MMVNRSLYGSYRTRKFVDIWGTVDDFLNDYKSGNLVNMTDENIKTLYYLLYARYGNSHIASSDEHQFKYQCWSIIWQYGPTWAKQIEIQEKLRNMTDDELLQGSRQIYNTSLNPPDVTDVANDELINTVNEQRTASAKRGKLEAFNDLLSVLRTNVTLTLLGKFQVLFISIVQPDLPLWYEYDKGDDDDDN